MKKTKKKMRRLQTFSWVGLLAPITGVFAYNFTDYFSSNKGLVFTQSVDISLGLIMSLSCGVLLAVGKTNALKGSKGFIIATLIAIFLKTIVNDLIVILGALSLGTLIFNAFQPSIKNAKDIYLAERNANINATAMQNVFTEVQQTVDRGRV